MKTVLNYKRPKFIVTALAVVVCVVIAVCFLTNPKEEYKASITAQAEGREDLENLEDLEVYEAIVADFTADEDYYQAATSVSSKEVEQFAMNIREDVLKADWESLSDKISFPASVNGSLVNDKDEFLKLVFEGKVSPGFVDAIKSESCREMFNNYQGISMGDMGQIWFSGIEDNGSWNLKIIGINAMLEVEE